MTIEIVVAALYIGIGAAYLYELWDVEWMRPVGKGISACFWPVMFPFWELTHMQVKYGRRIHEVRNRDG